MVNKKKVLKLSKLITKCIVLPKQPELYYKLLST